MPYTEGGLRISIADESELLVMIDGHTARNENVRL